MKNIVFFIFFLISIFGVGQEIDLRVLPLRPHPENFVNNFSEEFPSFLSKKESRLLESKLSALINSTSNEIVIVIIDDLEDYESWEYAMNIGNFWGIGQKNKNNGLVILIKPTGELGERKIHISIGRGLENAIPDALAKQIVDDLLIPNFKNGTYFQGIDLATDKLIEKLPK